MEQSRDKIYSFYNQFVHPMVRSLSIIEDVERYDKTDVAAIKDALENDTRLLVYNFWDGGDKNFIIESINKDNIINLAMSAVANHNTGGYFKTYVIERNGEIKKLILDFELKAEYKSHQLLPITKEEIQEDWK